jgi:hypothetical protein
MPYSDFLQGLVTEASVVPVAVAGVVGVVRFKRLPHPLRYLVASIVAALLVELVSRMLAARHQPNLFLAYLDTLLEFGLLAGLYRLVLRPSAVSRWLPAVVVVFSLSSLLPYLQPTDLLQFNTWQRLAESLLVLGLVLLYFYKIIRELLIVHLTREPLFLVSVGLLLYFSGNVFIFISSNYVLRHSPELGGKLWAIHGLLYMVLNSLYAIALWISPSTRK